MSSSSSFQTNLKHFIEENTLPCFALLKKETPGENHSDEEPAATKCEEIYLLQTFESDCVFAKSYSSNYEAMLINQRTSFAQSELEYLTWTSNYFTYTQSQNKKNMISEEISIPYCYQGLFEIFSTNSTKAGGILDHETDIITLASRFKTPSCYYVAKELNVYEILNGRASSFIHKYLNSLNLLKKDEKQPVQYSRKWTKFPVGTICKAVRIVDVDCLSDTKSYIKMAKGILCCQKSKNKSEMAFEFKVVENFRELMMCLDSNVPSISKKITEKLSEKSFYIPIDVDNPNKSIDLIPIASLNKNVILQNSLQTIRNFEEINILNNQQLELKLYADNLYSTTKKTKSDSKSDQYLDTELCRMNLNLEMNKFTSIYEPYESKPECKILVGYNIDKQQLFFTPISKSNPNITLSRMKDKDLTANKSIQLFKKKLDLINRLADHKISQFNFELNKMEHFNENIRKQQTNVDPVGQSNITKKLTISHFADLINCDFKKGSLSHKSLKNALFRVEKAKTPPSDPIVTNNENIQLVPFKLKNFKSFTNLKAANSIVLSQDILVKINEKMPHLKIDNQTLDYAQESELETLKSLELITTKQQPVKLSNESNLSRTRSRSLPSVFIDFKSTSSCCKKNIL